MKGLDKNYMIQQFTLESSQFKEFSKLITSAFLSDEAAKKEGATIVFNEDTFTTFFNAPTVDRDLFVKAIYEPTNEIVGFLGAIPRKISIDNKIYSFVVPAWLSVHPLHQKKGLATAMGMKLFEAIKNKGYNGGFGIFEPEQHGLDTSRAVLNVKGVPIIKLVTIKQFVIRVFSSKDIASVVKLHWFEKLFFKLKEKIKNVNNLNIRLFKSKDLNSIFELIKELITKNQISIVPSFDDIKWLLNRPNVICVVHENSDKKIDGFTFAWKFILAGFGNKIPFGWLETVHTYKLKNKDVKDLANFLCIEAKKAGWKGLQTPYIPYFNAQPFKKANFIFFSKKVTLNVANMSNVPLPKKVKSFYFDWR